MREGFCKITKRVYRECKLEEDLTWREYHMDPTVARLVLDLKQRCTWRKLSIEVTGYECQKTGQDLERIARWTLGIECD